MRIKERIRKAYTEGAVEYYSLMYAVFPIEKYPDAYRYSRNGGPPGCAMAFNRAIREMGGRRDYKTKLVYLPPESKQ